MTLHHLINMGGYGIYVWPAYFITLSVFTINLLWPLIEKRRVWDLIKKYHE